ncbi:MAG: STAS domain-containing protein [Pirellulales bacterium]|nr:STAS domain-containing protein [Pirellulales bacterium]
MESLTIQDRGDVVLVTFAQRRILDEGAIRAIGKEFEKLTLEAAADRKLLVSFRGVDFMSSAMIGQVVMLHKKCKADNIKLKLCDICPQVLEVFTITKLNKLLDIQKDEATALAAFSGATEKKKGWFG